MDPFIKHKGLVAPLDRSNVDTDQIIPKQFLKRIERTGFGEFAFFDWRYLEPGVLNPEFILNEERYEGASILVSGTNFGSGSSREHAPWALLDFGITCVISSSYADIFYNNCFKNGILPITLSEDEIKELSDYSKREEEISIDLQDQKIIFGNKETKFEIDQFKKKCLLGGLDDIALSLEKKKEIELFEQKLKTNRPWIFND